MTIDLDGASPGQLVEAASAIVLELAQDLGRALDVGEAALAQLVGVVDRSGEARRWGFSSTAAWLKMHLGMRSGRANERVMLLTTPASAGDDRDHAQRLADALISVLSQGHQRSALMVIIQLQTLQGANVPGRLPDRTPIAAVRVRRTLRGPRTPARRHRGW